MGATSFLRSQLTERKKYNSFLVGNQSLQPTIGQLEYLVIGGGGAGGYESTSSNVSSAGGGAGGYRSSVIGESSGGGASAESVFSFSLNTDYLVIVGAGGSAAVDNTNGSESTFASITSLGGGLGASNRKDAGDGGSGGGAGRFLSDKGIGTANQGFDGGSGGGDETFGRGGGGGGAGGSGGDGGVGTSADGGDGGAGITSSITGTAVGRAGGGAGGDDGTASDGGGTSSPLNEDGNPGLVNTGGGGGGVHVSGELHIGGNGGSGIVILRYPSSFTITIGAGLTATTSTVGANKVTEITAGTGNVSFN